MDKSIIHKSKKWTKINIDLPRKDLSNTVSKSKKNKKPDWLRVKLPSGKEFTNLRKIVDKHQLQIPHHQQ